MRESMEQDTSKNCCNSVTQTSLFALFNDDELEVVKIFLNLPTLIGQSESRFKWVGKRKRTSVYRKSSALHRLCFLPSPSSSLRDERESERRSKVKGEELSPDTPLAFSPSDTDAKLKQSHKTIPKKRTREEWLETVAGLEQNRDVLRREIENVKSYYSQLKALNLQLKLKKEQIEFALKNPEFEMRKHIKLESRQPILHPSQAEKRDYYSQLPYVAHQQPFFVDQTAHIAQNSDDALYPYLSSAPPVETFSVDCSQPLDHNSRVVTDHKIQAAAEARRRRRLKMNEMKGLQLK